MLNFIDIKEGDSAMDNYKKLIKKMEECSKNMSDDDVEWFDMGDFQVGMNKGLMDLLLNTDDAESQSCTKHLYNLKAEDKDIASRFKKYLDDLKTESEPQDDKKEFAWTTEPYKAPKNDVVNHPKHYTSGKYECLAVMADTFGVEAVKAFCRCNAFKYIWRSELKNGIEDLKKSIFYINFLIGLEEGKSAEQILNTNTK